jgi:metalloendopeptidase OMA1, mitochondrial
MNSNIRSKRRPAYNNAPPPKRPIPSWLIAWGVGSTSLGVFTYYYFQDEVPYTKRKRLLATSPEWERQQGDISYQQLLQVYRGNILPPDHRASRTVERVGSRIAMAATKIAAANKQTFGSKVTFTVVRSDQANAFVLPNNHVFVLTGLFKYVKDEDELAAVLGHEMAHNLARHAGERASGGMLTSLFARLTYLIDPSGMLYMIFVPSVNLLYDLPHSRDHEIEADYIGLNLAAEACYDPRAAKRVFAAMKQGNGNGRLSNMTEFISTHPSYDTRLDKFDEWMPKALNTFNGDDGYRCQKIRQDMMLARQHAAAVAYRREQQKERK